MLVATTSLLSNYRSTLAPRGSEWHPMTSIVTHKEHPAPGAPLAQFIYWLNQRLATPDRSAALARYCQILWMRGPQAACLVA